MTTYRCLLGIMITLAGGLSMGAQDPAPLVLENQTMRWELDRNGITRSLSLKGDRHLLPPAPASFMQIQIGTSWHSASAIQCQEQGQNRLLRVEFRATSVVARAAIRPHPDYFEIETLGLEGAACDQVVRWTFLSVPSSLPNAGAWLNVASDDRAAMAVIALDERTDAGGAPQLRASGIARLGLVGRKAALFACPRPDVLPLVRRIEQEQKLPSPTIAGVWAKTSPETRRSWLITGLTTAKEPLQYRPDRAFQAAEELGAHCVIISLSWWNSSLGSYPLNKRNFPDGVESLRAVARQAHARGLKLGLHVMTRSVAKNDPYVTPVPHPHLAKDGEATLAADVDASVTDLPTAAAPSAGFGSAEGYWAFGGMDVQIDDEIIHYASVRQQSPFGLGGCRRGANGTKAAPHKAGAKIQHITERYGWYVADAELGAEIGRRLAELVDQAELDAICFDGADVMAEPEMRFFEGHQVAQGLWRHARRDVMLFSNGSTHFGWHLMARGGEEDSMARGYQGWLDHRLVSGWAGYHRQNFMPPDIAWVGIFGATPTMWACRPDDIELVCARSLALDASIGWAMAACYGGPSNLAQWERNGRRAEIASVASAYEKLRIQRYFSGNESQRLAETGSHWRLIPPASGQSRLSLAPVDYLKSPIVHADDTTRWQATNRFAVQPARVRIEALPALAAHGSKGNRVLADFSRLEFKTSGNAAAHVIFARSEQVHPQAGAVARLSCTGPAPDSKFPRKLAGHGQSAWAQATAELPTKLDLRNHRALGLWIHGDGGGEVLNVQVMADRQSFLHYYQPIDFTGWRFCELGEPEGDRVMDYFQYEKFALHDMRIDAISGVTLMILNPPRGKAVELLVGRIEALEELGGRVSQPQVQIGTEEFRLPADLEPGQYLESGDLWGSRDPRVVRLFDANGRELSRQRLDRVPNLAAGQFSVGMKWAGKPAARARITLMPLGD